MDKRALAGRPLGVARPGPARRRHRDRRAAHADPPEPGASDGGCECQTIRRTATTLGECALHQNREGVSVNVYEGLSDEDRIALARMTTDAGGERRDHALDRGRTLPRNSDIRAHVDRTRLHLCWPSWEPSARGISTARCGDRGAATSSAAPLLGLEPSTLRSRRQKLGVRAAAAPAGTSSQNARGPASRGKTKRQRHVPGAVVQ